jgi:hypothetical protein
VQVTDQLRDLGVARDQAAAHRLRMRGEVAQPLDARHPRHLDEQRAEVGDAVVRVATAVGVDVLAEQRHLAHPLGGQCRDLGEHVVDRAADGLTAGQRHDAVGAGVAAALHDRDVGGRAVGARLRQAVELFDLRERHVDHRLRRTAHRVEHLWQAVQGLRSEHQVDPRRALAQRLAFLAGDAATDPDHQARALRLPTLPAAEQREDLLLGLLADRAGVEQQHVGRLRIVDRREAVRTREHRTDLVRVVLVHLATEGLDVELAGHGHQGRGTGVTIIRASPGEFLP